MAVAYSMAASRLMGMTPMAPYQPCRAAYQRSSSANFLTLAR